MEAPEVIDPSVSCSKVSTSETRGRTQQQMMLEGAIF